MTNYEWLVKSERLGKFIESIKTVTGPIYNGSAHDLKRNFGLVVPDPDKTGRSWHDYIAEWLQKEHTDNKYIKLDDVLDILSTPKIIKIEEGKFLPLPEVRRILAEDHKDRIKRINMLDVKEINE